MALGTGPARARHRPRLNRARRAGSEEDGRALEASRISIKSNTKAPALHREAERDTTGSKYMGLQLLVLTWIIDWVQGKPSLVRNNRLNLREMTEVAI